METLDTSLYEYRDLMFSSSALFITFLSVYISLLSAYLVVAYLVGKKLSVFQVMILSGLYVVAMLSIIAAINGNNFVIMGLAQEAYETYGTNILGGEGAPPEHSAMWQIFNIGWLGAGLITSLFFMWNIRRQEKRL